MRIYIFWVALAGCGFSGGAGSNDDAGPDSGGKDYEIPVIDFLAGDEATFSETSWTIGVDTLIDTTAGVITPAPAENVALTGGKQRDDSNSVMVLRVKDLTIVATAVVKVRGAFPLAIITGGEVRVAGILDAGATGGEPGPGGSTQETRFGVGSKSLHDGADDSGAGGGSFGSSGSPGGMVGTFSSAAGEVYAIGNKLIGGAAGGYAGACDNPAGAGGGAILIYARTRIVVDGAISAGGGGGAGGVYANCAPGAGAGAGGGSGGMIWLQTASLSGTGTLAANGGGGGGGARNGLSTNGTGGDGQDAKPSIDEIATGGEKGGGSESTPGGSGAIEGRLPSPVPSLSVGNGGGGGGGLGRIVYRAPGLGALQSSPTAVRAPE